MKADELLLKEAFKNGLLRSAQIQTCVQEQKQFPDKSMAKILLDHGFLTQKQIDTLMGDDEEDEDLFLSSSTVQEEEKEEKDLLISDFLPSVEEKSLEESNKKEKEFEEINFSDSLSEDKDFGVTPTQLPQDEDLGLFEDASEKDATVFTFEKSAQLDEVAQKNQEKKEAEKAPKKEKQTDTLTSPQKSPLKAIRTTQQISIMNKSMSTPFGKTAILLKLATQEQVNDALLSQVTESQGKKIGEIMVEKGYLTQKNVKTILSRQQTKTMGCTKCKKKYQIVLFQAGRSYKCKSCNIELVDAKKMDKKKPRKSEKLQVIGLTQAIPKINRDEGKKKAKKGKDKRRYDTSGLDFAPVEAGKENDQFEVISTERQLKEVGLEIPQAYEAPQRKTRRRQEAPEPNNMPLVLGIAALVIIFIVVFFMTGGKPKKIKKKVEVKKPVETAEQRKAKKVKYEFEKIWKKKINKSSSKSIKYAIKLFKNFTKKYPESSYTIKISEKIEDLEIALKNLDLKAQFVKETNTIQRYLAKNNFSKSYEIADKALAKYIESELENEIQKLQKRINEKALAAMNNTLKAVTRKEQNKHYKEAIKILEKEIVKQIPNCKFTLRKKQEALQKKLDDVAYSKIFAQFFKTIFPYIYMKKYSDASTTIEEYKGLYPRFEKELDQWEKNILTIEKIEKNLHGAIIKSKNKLVHIEIENSSQGKMILKSFNKKRESLILLSNGNFKNANIYNLTPGTLKRFLSENMDLNSFHERYCFVLYLLHKKSPYIIKEHLPELKAKKQAQRDIIMYMIAYCNFLIQKRKISQCIRFMKKLINQYETNQVFIQEQRLISKNLWNYYGKLIKRKKKRNARKILKILYKYFKDTPSGQKAKARLNIK